MLRSNLFAVILSAGVVTTSFASNDEAFDTQSKPSISAESLKAENERLHQQLKAMQDMMAGIQSQLQTQQSAIEQLPRKAAEDVVSFITTAVFSDEDGDKGPQPPASCNYNFVENLVGKLNALRLKSVGLGTLEEKTALLKQISALEEKLGITAERERKERQRLESERKKREEELLRRIAVLESTNAELVSRVKHEEKEADDFCHKYDVERERNNELVAENSALKEQLQKKNNTEKPKPRYTYK